MAVFIDLHSRRVVGWALNSALEHDGALRALRRAAARRRPPRGLIIHSDHGFQSVRRHRFHQVGCWPRVRAEHEPQGDGWDNAVAEPLYRR